MPSRRELARGIRAVLARRGWRLRGRAGQELAAKLARLVEHRRGSASVAERHEGNEGVDLLLRTTFACNQRCPFCFVPLTGRRVELAAIERELKALGRRPRGRRELTISGGEPTADPRLPRILKEAKGAGFRNIVLQTNGVLLDRPERVARLAELGVGSVMVSFHSHRPRLYDKSTGSRGLYPRAVAGLKNLLAEKRIRLTVNIVVNRWNYKDLPGYVGFLGKLCRGLARTRRPGVYFSMINEAGHLDAPGWTVSLEAAAPYLRRALARCRAEGLCVERFGAESSFPVCVTEEPARYAAQRAFPQDRVRYGADVPAEGPAVGRAKSEGCRRCFYDSRCVGVPVQYARLFGLGALKAP